MAVERIKLLGVTVGVVADDLIASERGNLGEYRCGRVQIAIDPKLPADQQGETLIHELLHAIDQRVSVDDRIGHDKLTAWAAVLHQVIRDNPEAVRAVMSARRIVDKD